MTWSEADFVEMRRLASDIAAMRFEVALLRLELAIKANFNPNQPRVPAGRPDGGQWTDVGGSGLLRVQYRPRGSDSRYRGPTGRWSHATPAQQTRLAMERARAEAAVARVRERDPEWRPTPSLSETIEGEIAAHRATAREAEARLRLLQSVGIGPGRFAVESIPARGPGRNFTTEERREINRIGRTYGCHTCGTRDPGTTTGNFFLDHQFPNARNPMGRSQRLFPHCATCSYRQGSWLRWNRSLGR